MIFHLTLLVSLYVALRGHNAPGGGFAGGLIAGAAFVFRILAGGSRRTAVARPAVAGRADRDRHAPGGRQRRSRPLIAGNEFLETGDRPRPRCPWIGDVKLVSAAVFDFGVYLLVIGVVIIVLGNLAVADPRRGASRECRHEPGPGRAHRRARRHRDATRCCTAA